jgi:hypothetical protein
VVHRDHSIDVSTERESMHCQGITTNISIYMCLTSAEGQMLDLLNDKQITFYKYYENLINPGGSKVMLIFYLTQTLSMCILQYLSLDVDS